MVSSTKTMKEVSSRCRIFRLLVVKLKLFLNFSLFLCIQRPDQCKLCIFIIDIKVSAEIIIVYQFHAFMMPFLIWSPVEFGQIIGVELLLWVNRASFI